MKKTEQENKQKKTAKKLGYFYLAFRYLLSTDFNWLTE